MLSPAIINLEKFNIWILNHPIGSTVDDLPTLFFGLCFFFIGFLYAFTLDVSGSFIQPSQTAYTDYEYGIFYWNLSAMELFIIQHKINFKTKDKNKPRRIYEAWKFPFLEKAKNEAITVLK